MNLSPYPTGAEFDPEAPWNRTETIEVILCADCGEEITEGERCKECAAVHAGMCAHCFTEPVSSKDSDTCCSCLADWAEYLSH